MRLVTVLLLAFTLLFSYSSSSTLRSLKVDSNQGTPAVLLESNPKIEDALRETPDISGKSVLQVLQLLIRFFILQGLYTTNPTAFENFKLLQQLEVEYRLNRSPLASGVRQIEALAEVFVIALNGYPDQDSGVQTIAINIAAKANGDANDNEVAKAYVAAVAINFGCNQAVIARNVAFADVSAEAFLDLNLYCEFGDVDDTGDVLPISPHYCLKQEKTFCCREQPTKKCTKDGNKYDVKSNQLYKNDELYCNCA